MDLNQNKSSESTMRLKRKTLKSQSLDLTNSTYSAKIRLDLGDSLKV